MFLFAELVYHNTYYSLTILYFLYFTNFGVGEKMQRSSLTYMCTKLADLLLKLHDRDRTFFFFNTIY